MNQIYFPVHPLIFRPDTIVSFDVYYRTPAENIESLLSAGETYSSTVKDRIGTQPVSTFYIRKADIYRYYRYLEKQIDDVFAEATISTRNKSRIAHHLLTGMARSLFTNPTQDGVARYKTAITTITDFILSTEEAISHLIQSTTSGNQEYNHNVNVGIYGLGLAKSLLNNKTHNMSEIAAGFFLHDIGKYSIPRHITFRNGPLSDTEWATMKKHPEEGFKLLRKFNLVTDETQTIILQHHERLDGSGYPIGLTGDNIHTYGRICSIADSFDALTSNRPYRNSQTSFRALAIMKKEMGALLDPEIFAQFVKLFSRAQNDTAL